MMLPWEYYLTIKLFFLLFVVLFLNIDLWNYTHGFIWVLRIFLSMGAWYRPKLAPLPFYLAGLIDTLIDASQRLQPLILKFDFICAHPMSLYKSCRFLFILGLCRHNLYSLTHKGSYFFCYLRQLGMANWFVIIFEAWHISVCLLNKWHS